MFPSKLVGLFSSFRQSAPQTRAIRCTAFFGSLLALASGAALAQAPVTVPGQTAVGKQAKPISVTVTMTAAGSGAVTTAVTQGIAGMDFQLATGSICNPTASFPVGSQCTVSVLFAPKYPGLRQGAVVVTSLDGRLLGSTLLNGNATGSLAVLTPGYLDTVAGDGALIFLGDNQPAKLTSIYLPQGFLTDAAGNMFIADTDNNRIRRVDHITGLLNTYAGTNGSGYNGDGIAATAATLTQPTGLALDGAGNLYFADSGNNIIRRVDAVSGLISTVAGTPGQQGYTGDGGSAVLASLTAPRGVTFDTAGNLYIADTGNNVVRKVDVATGKISTIAGNGAQGYNGDGAAATATPLNAPWSVLFGPDGLLYFTDLGNSVVRKMTAGGLLANVAGTGIRDYKGDGGPASAARLNNPAAITFSPAGDLYIADSGNDVLRKVDTSGTINTISGNGNTQLFGDEGPANKAELYAPYAIYFDQGGNLFFADTLHNRIREIYANPTALQYPDMKVGKISAPQAQGLENDGNDNLVLSTAVLASAALDASTTTCSFGGSMAPDANCILGVEFAPTTVGALVLGSVTVPSNAGNSATVINLSGQVLSVNPVTVTLTSSINPSILGAAVTFTATVVSDDPNISGPVTFLDGTTPLCSNIAIKAGVATCTTSILTLGQHSITASYAGDDNNEAKVSAPLLQTVQQTTTVKLTAAPNPAVVTSSVTLTVSVAGANGTPTGVVVFFDGKTPLSGNVALNSGTATFSTSTLAPGTHSLTAQYAGDTNDAAGTSNAVSEVINQAATTTTLSSSNVDVLVGTAVTFTATVTGTNGSTPTASVVFTDGQTVLGTVALPTSGASLTATLTLTSLTPGKHSIVATYNGDTNDAKSSSTTLLQTVEQIPTVTTLSSDNSSPTAGATLHLTATVAISGSGAADGAITGTVTFTVGTATLGTAQVDANGHATLSVIVMAGTESVIATYAGNTNYAPSASSSLVETVSMTPTTTVLSGSAAASLAGKPVTFTAAVTSSTGVPTGSVTFTDGANTLGVSPLNQGTASFTTSGLSVGTHSVLATYTGDSNYITSKSSVFTDVVSLATTSLTLTGPATSPVGVSVTLTGMLTSNGLTPTGTLTLLDGGTAILTQNAAASGSFTFTTAGLSVGTHTLTVSYPGDSNNAASASPLVTIVVQQDATTTALTSSANPSTLGQPVTLTAGVTTTGAALTGSVSFMDGSTLLGSTSLAGGTAAFTTSSLTVGAHNLTAVYSGDTNHATSTSVMLVEHIVNAAVAKLTSSVNPSTSGTNVVFTAQLTPVGSLVPTGPVTFRDGTSTMGVVTLDATGAATFQSSLLAVGSHGMSFSYPGDSNFATSSATLTQTVTNASTQIALTASANPATYATPLNLVATITTNGGTATGSVTFTENGTTLGSAVLNGSGVATLTLSTLTPGTHMVVANYAGDGKASASASIPLTVSVLQTTSTALTTNANPALTLNSVVLTATVSNAVGGPTGAVTFSDGATQLGIVQVDAKGVASLTLPSLSPGSHALAASYAGDGSDFPSTGNLTQSVQLRPTALALTSSQTDPANPQKVTLISFLNYQGPVAATGNITFTSGSTTLGTVPADPSGLATLTITMQSNATEQVVASYAGDVVYAGSNSAVATVTGGTATQFTLSLSPNTMSLQSKQHGTLTLTVASVKGFSDMLEFGCLGQPYASTCTFSSTQMQLAANGTATIQLTIDTGNPLGGGAAASSVAGSGRMLLLSLPLTLLLSFVLWRKGRKLGERGKLPALLLMAFGLALTFSATGCAGLSMTGTPPGTYSFLVTASGKGTGATQSQTMTLTVTQ